MNQDKEWVIEEPESEAQAQPDERENGSADRRTGAEEQGKPTPDSPGEGGAGGPGAEVSGTSATAPMEEEKCPSSSEEIAGYGPAGEGDEAEPVQKRTRRASRKELLELLRRKNAQLLEIDADAKKTRQELNIKEDKLLRLAAEFENYKKRTRREWELLKNRANADLIMEIIGGIDNFDRAFENLGEVDSRLRQGIELIHSGLLDVLKRAGLKEIEALNQKFDPVYHEAVGEIESEGIEEGHVARVVQKGYTLNDQMLRPSRVMLSKKKA